MRIPDASLGLMYPRVPANWREGSRVAAEGS